MNKKLKVGDKVMISKASDYYGISKSNPKDVEGVITDISGEVGSLPYYVDWSDGTRNNYEFFGNPCIACQSRISLAEWSELGGTS